MFSKRKLNQAYKITGKLRIIFILPIITGLLLVLLSLGIFVVNINAGYVMFIFTSIYIIINIFLVIYLRQSMLHELIEFSSNYSQIGRAHV